MSGSEKHIFGVAEVNQFIKTMLDGVPALQDLYVRGELSNYKIYPSGHHYFTLKDPEGVLRCVMFRSSASHLRFRPENGMKVIVRGRTVSALLRCRYTGRRRRLGRGFRTAQGAAVSGRPV